MMNRFLLTLFFSSVLSLISLAQHFTISGSVYDSTSRQPLRGASVFCQNTTLGTVTDADGNFRMTLANGGYDLVISFTGYETQSFRITPGVMQESYQVALLPKEKSMEAVSIQVTTEVRDGWNKYGNFFTKHFIGTTPGAELCTIQNPEALRFFFSKKKNQLKVKGREEIVLINKSLGYKVRYELDSFIHEYGSGVTHFTGYPFFEELEGSPEEKESWEKNRIRAYYGGMLHFMRAYYDGKLSDEGYRVELIDKRTKKTSPIGNPYDTTYFLPDSSNVEIQMPGNLRVVFSSAPHPEYLKQYKLNTTYQISVVELSDAFVIEQNGYFWDQKDMTIFGYWDWKKMADFLPYNYMPAGEQRNTVSRIE